MAVTDITKILPVLSSDKAVANAEFELTSIGTATDGVLLKVPFEAKDNSTFIIISNTGASAANDGTATIKAGGHYPNSMKGDFNVDIDHGEMQVITIEDLSRFETKEGNVKIVFSTGFTGAVAVIAKSAGIAPVA